MVLIWPPPPTNHPWILSCIYGLLEKVNKPTFWDSLIVVGEDFVNPWLCIGDFNFVLDQSEKLGGRPITNSSHCSFKGFIDQLGLVDLRFVGNPFTWCNNRQGFATIKERLDKGLASLDWIHQHLEFSLTHLPASIYDHNPISLNTNTSSAYLPRPFKFEEFWTLDPTCGNLETFCYWLSSCLLSEKANSNQSCSQKMEHHSLWQHSSKDQILSTQVRSDLAFPS